MTRSTISRERAAKIRLRAGKTSYTQEEAALALGVSAAQFRLLLLRHVVEKHALGNLRLLRFGPSDLLLLAVLALAASGAPSHLGEADVSKALNL